MLTDKKCIIIDEKIFFVRSLTVCAKDIKRVAWLFSKKRHFEGNAMPKENATLKKLGPWDEFLNREPLAAAEAMYRNAEATYMTVSGWYWKNIGRKRATAIFIRSLTVLLVIAATIMQAFATVNDTPQTRLCYTQCVLTALAVAGLLQLADRVFGWSSGWTRYVTTATAIEVRTRQLQRDWSSALISTQNALQIGNLSVLYELVKSYEADVLKEQVQETLTWVAEFNSGSTILGEAITALRNQNKGNFAGNPAAS